MHIFCLNLVNGWTKFPFSHVNELKHMITCWERINHTSKLTKLVDNSTDRRLLILQLNTFGDMFIANGDEKYLCLISLTWFEQRYNKKERIKNINQFTSMQKWGNERQRKSKFHSGCKKLRLPNIRKLHYFIDKI